VSDKEGIAEFAKRLQKRGIEVIATGGTAEALKRVGVRVRDVTDVTGFPECFGGKVKTLHPNILGGILMDRKWDASEAKKLGIEPIDLVVVQLYEFPEAKDAREARGSKELIDIGGVTMLRAAAKNWESVTVVSDPGDYEVVLEQIEKSGDTTVELRKGLAAKAFLRTAKYDAAITEWLSGGRNHGLFMTGGKKLRYGENPHQSGKIFGIGSGVGVACAQVLQGKEMSYLNYLDADAAWQCVMEFGEPTAVFLKHASPCGVASNTSILEAFRRGYDSDPRSAFGVIIALNRECPASIAEEIIQRRIFTELLLAPGFTKDALNLLKKKPNIRVLMVSGTLEKVPDTFFPEYRSISGGILLQSSDRKTLVKGDLKVVTKVKPTKEQITDLLFAAKVVKHVKSNAVVFAKDQVTVGIGPGQTSRVDATEIAARKAGAKAKGAVMASDAFFPFPDSVEEAAAHGIAAIVQPGGSIRDSEMTKKADEIGIAMVFTGVRAFKH
jgi:phosphoribosylaminoimidazolecarboxamide formyltransferase/IMP cyclohydrolase